MRDVEDIPRDQVVVGEVEITVGVSIATRQTLPWTTSRAVLQKEQHVTHAENWDILNEHAEELERDTNQWRGRGRVGLLREENEQHQKTQNVSELNEDPVSRVNHQGCGENESVTSGSDDYMVMSIKRKKNQTELKIPGARVQVEMSGKKMWLWIDSGSPVTIFSINDLKTTLGKANVQLQPSKEEFLDYNNNRINILGKVTVMMSLNGWAAPARVSVISGNHQSILERDLMGTLGLELVQRKKVMGITGEGTSQEEEEYDELQTYFCKLYPNFFY